MCRARAGPMGGAPLPLAGGPGDQPAALMDAFALLDGAIGEGADGPD